MSRSTVILIFRIASGVDKQSSGDMGGDVVRNLEIERSNHRLNVEIERFIDAYEGTAIGVEVRNMYENGTSYESICEKMEIDYEDYEE